MIKQEQAEQYLAPFKPKELKKEDLASFSQSYQKLGEYILNKPSSKEQRHLEANFSSLGLPEKLWETKEGKALAALLFSEVQALYIQRVWDIAYQFPYSYSYSRRPFRSPNPEDYRAKQLRILKRLRSFYNVGVGALSVEEQFQYAFYKGGEEDFFVVVLSENPDTYYPLFEEIFLGEHEIGGVCESLIKAALMVKDARYHTLVEKLLLAAQLQEGLRQTILESLDETTIPVLQRFIALILEHNLTRFSSVVRAVDVWFGFGWEAPQQAVVKRTLELAQTYLADLDKAREAVSSKDNVERYVALWAVAVYNVQEALSLATEALNNTQTSYEACVAVLYFMYQTQKKTSEILPFAEKYFGIEPAWDYWILQNLPKGEIPQELFEKMRTAAHKLPKDGKNFEGLGFRWLNFTVKPLDIYQSVLKVANEQQQQILAGELAEIPVVARHILCLRDRAYAQTIFGMLALVHVRSL